LFVTCCVTTTLVGGPAFGATLMGILLCHEAGHYIVGRLHGEDVSLPYFIPMPPFLTLGTLGAVIRMRKPIRERKKLFDVGAAGPVAGLIVAITLLVRTARSRATLRSTHFSSTPCTGSGCPATTSTCTCTRWHSPRGSACSSR
jgi:membrane-associated protease RseP (regulator of RpoE activity)